jgi:hypothetical protein
VTVERLVIETLASSEAELRASNRALVDLVADLAFENALLHILYDRELRRRPTTTEGDR